MRNPTHVLRFFSSFHSDSVISKAQKMLNGASLRVRAKVSCPMYRYYCWTWTERSVARQLLTVSTVCQTLDCPFGCRHVSGCFVSIWLAHSETIPKQTQITSLIRLNSTFLPEANVWFSVFFLCRMHSQRMHMCWHKNAIRVAIFFAFFLCVLIIKIAQLPAEHVSTAPFSVTIVSDPLRRDFD